MKDNRKWFAVNFGRTYFKSAPLINPMAPVFGIAIPCLVVLAAMLLWSHPEAGLVLAATPVIPAFDLKTHFDQLTNELKQYKEKAESQQKEFGTISTDLKSQIEKLQKQVDAIDVKMAERHAADQPEETVEQFLEKHDGVQRLLKDKSGSCVIELNAKQAQQLQRKTTITSSAVGSATSGVIQIERVPGIVLDARPKLRMRGVLSARPTSLPQIDFVKVNAALSPASPQVEASAKSENAVTFTVAQAYVRTLATWIPATRQVLDDFKELMGFLMNSLPNKVDQLEDLQILSGDNTGQNLNGLINQAQTFDTSLLVTSLGWNYIDILGRAVQQIEADNEVSPTFVVLNPNDFWTIRLTKDSYGRYIFGDPQQSPLIPNIFGLAVVVTSQITTGTFLVGTGSSDVAEIRDRMGMTVEIATQHSDYFTKNMVAIRAEKRVALVVYRPDAFVTGSFTTSP